MFRKLRQVVTGIFRNAAILAACRSNNVQKLKQELTKLLNSGDEGVVTEKTVLACLQYGSEWRIQAGKLTDSALDCASVVLAFSLRLKILNSGLLPSQDLEADFTEEPQHALWTLLGKAFGGFTDFDMYLSPEDYYFDPSRQQHMLVLVVAALLGYGRIIECCHCHINCDLLFVTLDWIMLATVAGQGEMLKRIVAGERPRYCLIDTAVVFPYLLTLAEVFGRDLRESLRIFAEDYQRPCRASKERVSMYKYLDCVMKFIKSSHAVAPTALLSTRLDTLCHYAEFVFDVDAGHRLQVENVTMFTGKNTDYFLPYLHNMKLPRSLRKLCFTIFQKMCRFGAASRFLLDVSHWWDSINKAYLKNLLYYLAQCSYLTSKFEGPRNKSCCKLCVYPVASCVLYLEKRREDKNDHVDADLAGAGMDLKEFSAFIEDGSLEFLQKGDSPLCREHQVLFPTLSEVTRLGKAMLEKRVAPDACVVALKNVLMTVHESEKNLATIQNLEVKTYLDYAENMRVELDLT